VNSADIGWIDKQIQQKSIPTTYARDFFIMSMHYHALNFFPYCCIAQFVIFFKK